MMSTNTHQHHRGHAPVKSREAGKEPTKPSMDASRDCDDDPLVFVDRGETIWDMIDSFLVRCPKCRSCARIIATNRPEGAFKVGDKFACRRCGYIKDRGKHYVGWGPNGVEIAHVGFCLWLVSRCCGNRLWAYNERHLDWLERYVQAKQRKRQLPENRNSRYQNSSLASRVPKWISAADNRHKILRRIAELRMSIPSDVLQ